MVAAAEAGKHVLVEKPMALSVAGCDRMIAACAETDRILSVVCRSGAHDQYIIGSEGILMLQGDRLLLDGEPVEIEVAAQSVAWRAPVSVA